MSQWAQTTSPRLDPQVSVNQHHRASAQQLSAKASQALEEVNDASSFPGIILCGPDPWDIIESAPFLVFLPL